MKILKNLFLILVFLILLCFLHPKLEGNINTDEQEISEGKAFYLILKACNYEIQGHLYRADSGRLIVPENRNNPDSRPIHLPLIRIYASGENPAEPVFLLYGGPGESNIWYYPQPWLLEYHDIVMVGYRGVDGSVSLDCPEFVEAKKVEKDPLSSENMEKLGKALFTAFRRLKNEGVDVDGYNVLEVVDDIDAAREALEYKKINLYGHSWGGRPAYIYGLRYPENVHRTVLHVPSVPGWFILEPKVIDAKLKYIADLWQKEPDCVSHTPDLIGTIQNVVKSLPKEWHNIRVDPDKVKIVTQVYLRTRDQIAQVIDAYVAAEKGDYSGLAYLSFAYDEAYTNSTGMAEMFSKKVSVDFDPNRDYEFELVPPGSIIGSPKGKLQFGPLKYGGWPIKLIPEEYRKPQYSDVQTLVISGSIDFDTPVENTKKFIPYLRNGKHVIISEMAHLDVGNVQQEAFQHLVETFYLEGIVDDSKFKYEPMNFTPSRTFQDMAYRIGKESITEVLLKTIKEKDIESAIKQYYDLKGNYSDTYYIDEYEVNILGYQMLGMKKTKEAIEIFKLNVEAFPKSSNVFDSLGEAYMIAGYKELAIKNYRKSLELNPDNKNAALMLKKLQEK